MPKQFDLQTATIEECKAMAYDLLLQSQRLQNDLQTLNNAIATKTQEATKDTPKE